MGIVPNERSGLRPSLLQSVGGEGSRDTRRRNFHAEATAAIGIALVLAVGAFDGRS